MIKRILLMNPPYGMFQRGEERCQADVEGGSAISLRPPNNLGYIASILKNLGKEVVIRDYPVEKDKDFIKDLKNYNFDLILMSITTGTIEEDLKFFKTTKNFNKNIITIAEGAHFITAPIESFKSEIFKYLDFAFFGESEYVVKEFINSYENNKSLSQVKGLIYKDNGEWIKNEKPPFIENLDFLPFPARDLMRNDLYKNPDTDKPMATIQTSRGCPGNCIYCLAPIVSGKNLRKRSPKNIVDEIEECINKYKIDNFFLRADTFTIDKDWVIEISNEIIKRNLKIVWVANSRVKPIDEEMLIWMKRSGCYLIAFGLESGSEKSLKLMKKGVTVEDNINAVKLAKKLGFKVYSFFIIGFPWEDREDILKTIELSKKLPSDFVEFHIATPYYGTELYDIMKKENLLDNNPEGHNYFSNPVGGTKYLTREEIINLRKKALLSFYLRPNFILKTLLTQNPKTIKNYIKYGFKLIKNNLF
ncbi:MAG: B12-binding domain-containing radical SAM protein [Caldisericia bacterium]|uniref:B12-binding domain-containing radical SAM protein n=1 Tax=Thermodesulfovibrio yellowstonii TaxID=28262 RepID=UPI003C7C78AB